MLNLPRTVPLTPLDALRALLSGYSEGDAQFAARLNQQPLTLPQMLCAWMFELAPKRQIVISGPSPEPFLRAVRRRFLPSTLVFVNPSEGELAAMTALDGKTAVYVCVDYACQLPVTTVAEFAGMMDGK